MSLKSFRRSGVLPILPIVAQGKTRIHVHNITTAVNTKRATSARLFAKCRHMSVTLRPGQQVYCQGWPGTCYTSVQQFHASTCCLVYITVWPKHTKKSSWLEKYVIPCSGCTRITWAPVRLILIKRMIFLPAILESRLQCSGFFLYGFPFYTLRIVWEISTCEVGKNILQKFSHTLVGVCIVPSHYSDFPTHCVCARSELISLSPPIVCLY